jgi:hypothetical protein
MGLKAELAALIRQVSQTGVKRYFLLYFGWTVFWHVFGRNL